ncbi:aldo/keto reductase [Candidatus Nitrosotenuis uzonensis]|uniref:Aldo/keto reductase n=1 Tax=Candidatus Nitrosotenuis uzonensis TaxID=1407055 RepID=V6ATF4_9ARCH|nr:aldo/keto reductase [Candidatus Nitrosotenuis uzonensis]CDI05713.1 Aldo/keto reductase [Candidatus Nitrosotenuis uzonensis]
MISGFSTPEGTKKFSEKHGLAANFRLVHGLTLSNVGMGTYLGNPDAATDTLVTDAIKKSVMAGINVIDTAINYRAQKAERSVGRALSELIQQESIKRDQIFVSTKNGYITNDADIKEDFWAYVQREYTKPGIIGPDDISSGYHCMKVSYLEDQLNRSLKNLGLECVDLMYLHNAVEGQIQDISKEEFVKNLKQVFEMYEQKRRDGKIRFYGMATWECFRVGEDNPQYLSLSETVSIAKQIGGDDHGFRFIQLPYNMYYDQAFMAKNQKIDGIQVSVLDAAQKLGIGIFTSVPLMQGRLLAPGTIPEFGQLKPSLRCLQFIRSTPGVLAPLVGQKDPSHVQENLEILKVPPMSHDEFIGLVRKLVPSY